jgi:hypothetical protein
MCGPTCEVQRLQHHSYEGKIRWIKGKSRSNKSENPIDALMAEAFELRLVNKWRK